MAPRTAPKASHAIGVHLPSFIRRDRFLVLSWYTEWQASVTSLWKVSCLVQNQLTMEDSKSKRRVRDCSNVTINNTVLHLRVFCCFCISVSSSPLGFHKPRYKTCIATDHPMRAKGPPCPPMMSSHDVLPIPNSNLPPRLRREPSSIRGSVHADSKCPMHLGKPQEEQGMGSESFTKKCGGNPTSTSHVAPHNQRITVCNQLD